MRSRSLPLGAMVAMASCMVLISELGALRQVSCPLQEHPERAGNLGDHFWGCFDAAVGIDNEHGDAGLAHLQHHIPGSKRGIGDNHGGSEFEDCLGIELMAVMGDQRQVLDFGEVRGHVPTDHVLAQAEVEDDPRRGAVQVDGQDARRIADRDLGALRIRDGDGKDDVRVLRDGIQCRLGQECGGRPCMAFGVARGPVRCSRARPWPSAFDSVGAAHPARIIAIGATSAAALGRPAAEQRSTQFISFGVSTNRARALGSVRMVFVTIPQVEPWLWLPNLRSLT